MTKIINTTLCALWVATAAGAQTPTATAPTPNTARVLSLSLDECVREAVANNMQLRNADNRIDMATEQQREAFTKYFPTVSATGMGIAANRHLIQMDLGGMGMGLIKNGVTAGVTAMQPVFAGGQIVNANRLAAVGRQTSRLQRDMTANEVRLTTETYYWQIVMLQEKLRTIDQVTVQIDSARRDAQAAVEAGVRNRNDLLQVQLRKNEMRTSRIEVANDLDILCCLLAQYIGHAHDSIDIQSPLSAQLAQPQLPESPASLYIAPETALPSTNEYQLLGKQIDAERLQYRMTVGKNLPTMAVGGGYLYNDLMDRSSSRLVGMVTMSVPISGWWGGRHDMRRQKLQVQNATNEQQDQSQLLLIRMRKAWNGMNDAYHQVAIAIESMAQSEENLRLNTDYYRAGTATISDVLDAQTLYQQSRDKYVEAYTQYEIKRCEYLSATGRQP